MVALNDETLVLVSSEKGVFSGFRTLMANAVKKPGQPLSEYFVTCAHHYGFSCKKELDNDVNDAGAVYSLFDEHGIYVDKGTQVLMAQFDGANVWLHQMVGENQIKYARIPLDGGKIEDNLDRTDIQPQFVDIHLRHS